MTKKVLPMKYPPITSWTWHANLLSILSNYEETLPWIYNNYIQLWSDTHGLFFDFWPKSNIIFDCPWLYNQTLKRETIAGMSTNLSQFFVDAIDLDNYIYGIFDESCIAGSLVHQKKISPHELFIFGYNLEEQMFDVADFTFTGKYSYTKASFEQVEQAYLNIDAPKDYLEEGRGGLHLLSFFNKASYHFDTSLVAETLNDYLLSKNTSERFRMMDNPRDFVFGMKVYEDIKHYLDLLLQNKDKYDIKPLHVLWDHKVMMLKRIQYMKSRKLMNNADIIYNNYKQIVQNMLMFRNMLLKAQLTRNSELIKKIIIGLDDIVSKERCVVEMMLDNLIFTTIPPRVHYTRRTGTIRV
ncbi:hypothetical protein MKY96_21450 [Paenibacillus sp. FSL R7-0302]|uniref:hypothetical protein n=1 Tax=Paenibacillus sp. FSL R7-0302 TaxID=2921681 RepID=UPI0030F8CFF2